jgi:hypothetical protein
MKRWISHWTQRYRDWRARRTYTKLKAEALALSNFQAGRKVLAALLQRLDVSRFLAYRSSQAVGVEIRIYYPTIDAYHREIKIINSLLMRESALSPGWAALEARSTGLDHFFTSKDGFYLNVPEALAAFKQDALILCTLMQTSDNATLGVHEHNLRMLTKLMVNMRQLVVALIDLSLDIQV